VNLGVRLVGAWPGRRNIGPLQGVPNGLIESGRTLGMVFAGEADHQGLRPQSREFTATERTVIPVLAPAGAQGQPQLDCDRGQRPAQCPQPGVAFSDIMEQRRPHRPEVVESGANPASAVMPVPLVGRALGEEQGCLPWSENCSHPGLLVSRQRRGTDDRQKTTRQMAPAARHYPRRDLQSTHRIEAGRTSSRTAGISLPQLAQWP